MKLEGERGSHTTTTFFPPQLSPCWFSTRRGVRGISLLGDLGSSVSAAAAGVFLPLSMVDVGAGGGEGPKLLPIFKNFCLLSNR